MEEQESIEQLCDDGCAVDIADDVGIVDTESTTDILDALINERLTKLNNVRAMIDAGEVTDMAFKVKDKEFMLELLGELENDIIMGINDVEYVPNSKTFAGREAIENGVIIVRRVV